MGYSKRGMEYQFADREPATRSAIRGERRSSSALRGCSLTGYGVRFRTRSRVTGTSDRETANPDDEIPVKQHKFPWVRRHRWPPLVVVRRLHSAGRMRDCEPESRMRRHEVKTVSQGRDADARQRADAPDHNPQVRAAGRTLPSIGEASLRHPPRLCSGLLSPVEGQEAGHANGCRSHRLCAGAAR